MKSACVFQKTAILYADWSVCDVQLLQTWYCALLERQCLKLMD